MKFLRLVGLVWWGVCGALLPAVAEPATFSITDIGATGGTGTSAAYDLNDAGQVVGTSNNHALRWTPAQPSVNGGKPVLLDLGTLGGSYSEAWGVNASGYSVGNSYNSSSQQQGFEYTTGPMFVRGGPFSAMWDINDAGTVVGRVRNTATGMTYAIAYDASGGIIRPAGDMTLSTAYGINAAGHITGYSETSPGLLQPFRYTASLQSLPMPTGGYTTATGRRINDNDEVAGYANATATLPQAAFYWSAATGTKTLPTLGGRQAAAYGINNAGVVVGWAEIADGTRHAALWQKDSAGQYQAFDLNALSPSNDVLPATSTKRWLLSAAYGINSAGQICGAGTLNSQARGFVLVPTLHGVDISSNTGPVSTALWGSMKSGGWRVAVAQLWGGRSTNSQAVGQLKNARLANLKTGAYTFLNFDNGATSGGNQTGRWQVNKSLLAAGSEAGYLAFLAIDVEDKYKGSFSPVNRVPLIQEAVQAVSEAGLTPVLYTSRSNWSTLTNNSAAAMPPLWDARYGLKSAGEDIADIANDYDGAFKPYGPWSSRVAKQYGKETAPTAKGVSSKFGIGVVDVDVFDPLLFPATAPAPVTIPVVTLNPEIVLPGHSVPGTVTLCGPAPAGGATVALSSSLTQVTVPATLNIPAGSVSATFQAAASASAPPNTAATITATLGASRTSAKLQIGVALNKITLSPATVTAGGTSTGTVTLTGPAPAGGAKVTLTSNNTAAPVPASVTVPAGATKATFTIKTSAVPATKQVAVTGVYNWRRFVQLTVNPAPTAALSGALEPASE